VRCPPLADIRGLAADEEADSCQWPGCDGPADVWIWVAGTAGGTLKVTRHTIELVPQSREGVACAEHGHVILTRLPRDEIDRVNIYGDPDDPEDYSPPGAEAARAIIRDWPDAPS
jgi:hypothetical protein